MWNEQRKQSRIFWNEAHTWNPAIQETALAGHLCDLKTSDQNAPDRTQDQRPSFFGRGTSPSESQQCSIPWPLFGKTSWGVMREGPLHQNRTAFCPGLPGSQPIRVLLKVLRRMPSFFLNHSVFPIFRESRELRLFSPKAPTCAHHPKLATNAIGPKTASRNKGLRKSKRAALALRNETSQNTSKTILKKSQVWRKAEKGMSMSRHRSEALGYSPNRLTLQDPAQEHPLL